MWKEVKPEKEQQVTEKVAQAIMKYDMEALAVFFLESMMPLYFISGQVARMVLGPYLPPSAFDYISVFEKKENAKKVIERVKELRKEKEKVEPKKLGLIERFKRFTRK